MNTASLCSRLLATAAICVAASSIHAASLLDTVKQRGVLHCGTDNSAPGFGYLNTKNGEMQGLDVQWNTPDGGMFLWVRLPQGMSAIELLPKAVEKGVAFVPGAPFYAGDADPRCLRLSFVTATVEQIDTGIGALAAAIRAMGSQG